MPGSSPDAIQKNQMIPTNRATKIAKTSVYHLSHPNLRAPHNNLKRSDFKTPSFDLERELWSNGYKYICGLDEAGRGAWAGPLVTAAVILPDNLRNLPFRDSKDLKPEERQAMLKIIKKKALSFSVGLVESVKIDKVGIQTATYLSFNQSIATLRQIPDFLLIDYYRLPGSAIMQKSIKFGDRISMSIAAASIVAKVTRDEIMKKLSKSNGFEKYGFEQNLGYGTRDHQEKIKQYGLSQHHRKTFCRFDSEDQKSFNFG